MSKKEKTILCIFGVVPRSIKYVYDQVEKLVINPLKDELDLDIYVFNMNVGDSLVDGVKIDQNDCKIIPYNYFEEAIQDEIDKEHDSFCSSHDCSINNRTYPLMMVKNQFRVMHSEMRCSIFMAKNVHRYKYAIMWSSDYYPVTKINVKDLVQNNGKVFTSDQYDCNGYTDGFYMGNIRDIIKISRRYLLKQDIVPTKLNYESILKKSFDDNKIKRGVTPMLFIKVRANLEDVFYGKYSSDVRVKEGIKFINQLRLKIFP